MSFLINGGIPEGDLPVKSPSGAARVRYVDGDGKSYSSAMPDVIAASALVQDAIDGIVADAESEIGVIVNGMGYLPPVAFASGLNVDSGRFTVTYSGVTYAPVADAVPFTTTGTFNPAQWRVVQGVTEADLGAAGGASLVGFKQGLTGASERTAQSKLRDWVSIQDFGGIADGSTSIVPAIDKARNAGVKRLRLPAGNYAASGTLNIGDMCIEGDGDSTVITAAAGFSGDYLIESIGALDSAQTLGANASVGSWSITMSSAPAMAAGDVFVIYNPAAGSWSNYRTYYHAGEWCEVSSVVGNVVHLKSPLYDSYNSADVSVYRMSGRTPTVRNLRVSGDTAPIGLCHFELCNRPLVENVTGSLSNNSIISFARCFRPTALNPSADNYGDGGDDYGISIGNSQHARIVGGAVYARRHGLAVGGSGAVGAVPVRDARIIGALVRKSGLSNVAAADFHGNSEDCSYENCTIYGGAMSRGRDNFYKNCTITASPGLGACVQGSEILGGAHGFYGCKFVTYEDPQVTSRGVLDFGGNSTAFDANMKSPLTIEVVGCSIYGRNLSGSTSAVRVVNRGTTLPVNVFIDGLRLDVNALDSVLYTFLFSGTAASSGIVVDGVYAPAGVFLHNASGGFYRDVPHRLMQQSGIWTSLSTAASFVASGQIPFRYKYPRSPAISVSLRPDGTGTAAAAGQVGGQVAVASVYQGTSTYIRPMVRATATMAAGDPFAVSWSADIREC